MIILEIYPDGQATPLIPKLSPDVTFEMICENPIFGVQSEYTYDIDISLRDPINRKIYENMDRLAPKDWSRRRRAILSCGGKKVCEGEEVILKKEDDIVKIQIIAGYTVMTSLITADSTPIRRLSFGFMPTGAEAAASVATKIFPETYYAFPIMYNRKQSRNENVPTDNNGDTPVYGDSAIFWPQPFLLYYVERFVAILGYNLKYNALRENPKWCRLLVMNGSHSTNCSDILPDWTAKEFLENLENFFNCVFIVNRQSGEAEIRKSEDWAANGNHVYVDADDVVESFYIDVDEDNSPSIHDYRNVSYDANSGDFWSFASLDKKLEENCYHQEMDYNHDIGDWPRYEWRVYTDPTYGFQFVIADYTVGQTPVLLKRMVNQFKPFVLEENAPEVKLKIIPVEIRTRTVPAVTEGESTLCNALIAAPKMYDGFNDDSFYDSITGGLKEDVGKIMEVAFFGGMIYGRLGPNNQFTAWAKKPMAFTQKCSLNDSPFFIYPTEVQDIDKLTLELNGEKGMGNTEFNGKKNTDFKNKYTIKFISREIKDPSSLFIIAGHLFICQQLKYTFQDGKMHPVAEGVFYPYSL